MTAPLRNFYTPLKLSLTVVTLFIFVLSARAQMPPVPDGTCSRTSLQFNTSDQFLTVESSPLNGNAGTFEGWIRREHWGIHTDEIIFSNGIGFSSDNSLYLSLHPVGLHFRYGKNEVGAGTAAYNDVSYSNRPSSWHHVAATWENVSGTTTIRVFLDGNEISSSEVQTVIDPGNKLYFGRNDQSSNFGDGAMADFRFWNVAKTSAQIKEKMNQMLVGNEDGLIGYWPMNETGATKLVELVGARDAEFTNPTTPFAWQYILPIALAVDVPYLADSATREFSAGIGQSSQQTWFWINNLRTTTINLTGDPIVSITGTDADQFVVDVSGIAVAAPRGQSSFFPIHFAPTTLGIKSAVATIEMEGCDEVVTVNLLGTAVPALTIAGPGFKETAANNGVVEGSITITVAGTTFADGNGDNLLDVGSDVFINSVPDGLTAVMTLINPNQVVLTFLGKAEDHVNPGEGSEVQGIAFQFSETAFVNGGSLNVDSEFGIDFENSPMISYGSNYFTETSDNLGEVTGFVDIYLEGDVFETADGILDIGTQVTIGNVPAGLTPVVTVTDQQSQASVWEMYGYTMYGDGWRAIVYDDYNENFIAVSHNGAYPFMLVPEEGIDYWEGLAAEPWTAITYGDERFVAVGFGGKVISSTQDGTGYRTAAEPNDWTAITYHDGLFVAVASSGTNRVMSSPGGQTWTAHAAAEANLWQSITYGEGLFVAVSSDGDHRVMTSPDGQTWTARVAAEANSWTSIAYGEGRFVAVASDGNNSVMTSDDGITWTSRSAPDGDYRSIAYGEGIFVAVAHSGTNPVIVSQDGETWVGIAGDVFGWKGIAYGNGIFRTVGGESSAQMMFASATARAHAQLTFTGKADAHQAANNVPSISFEFTDLAFASTTADLVVNAIETREYEISFTDNPSITYSGDGFQETVASNGAVFGSIVVNLQGELFQDNDENGELEIGSQVIVNNIPAGLTPVLQLFHNASPLGSVANLILTGTASDHTTLADVENITFEFADAAFYSVAAVAVLNSAAPSNSGLGVNFGESQMITFDQLDAKTYGDESFSIAVTASSELEVTFTSSDETVATISSNVITIVGAGSTIITASQSGSDEFNPTVEGRELVVSKKSQTIMFSSLTERIFAAGDEFELSASTDSPLTIAYSSSNEGAVMISGNIATILGAGTVMITASQSGNDNFNPAENVQQALTVKKADQTITFGPLANRIFLDEPFTLEGTVGAEDRPVTYASSNETVAVVSGNLVIILSAGTTTITASQAGNDNYRAAENVEQTLTVLKADQTIEFNSLDPGTFVEGGEFLLSGGASSYLNLVYTSSDESIVEINSGNAYILGAGTVTITASQPGNNNYNAAEVVERIFIVNKAVQTIVFNPLSEKTFGDASFELNATVGQSENTVTYSSSDESVATMSGSTVTIIGAGTTTITASQSGNQNYSAAEDVQQDLIVNKAGQVITFNPISDQGLTQESMILEATADSSLPVSFAVSGPVTLLGNVVTFTGPGTVTVTASQSGNENYLAATEVSTSFEIIDDRDTRLEQTISLADLQPVYEDEGPVLLDASTTSGLTITYTIANGPASVSGNTLTILGSGDVFITASQPGNDEFKPATDVTVTLTIKPLLHVSGKVTGENNSIVEGVVQILSVDGSIVLESNTSGGVYQVDGLKNGEFYLRFIPATPFNKDYFTTYYNGSALWTSSTKVILVDEDLTAIDWQAAAKSTPGATGNGKINGRVVTGNENSGGRFIIGRTYDEGTGIPAVSVYLLNDQNQIVVEALTDAEGYFSMESLVAGSYKLHIDIPGVAMDVNTSTITIDESKTLSVAVIVGDLIVTQTEIVTGLDETSSVHIKIFPVPTSDFVHIQIFEQGGEMREKNVRLYDLMGREQLQGNFSGPDYVMDLQKQTRGVYILVVRSGPNLLLSNFKLVKE